MFAHVLVSACVYAHSSGEREVGWERMTKISMENRVVNEVIKVYPLLLSLLGS